jgi:hypothetical protein
MPDKKQKQITVKQKTFTLFPQSFYVSQLIVSALVFYNRAVSRHLQWRRKGGNKFVRNGQVFFWPLLVLSPAFFALFLSLKGISSTK